MTIMKKIFYLSIISTLFLSCSSSKKTSKNNDFEVIKLKGLPFWQIKKELTGNNYKITDIKRTWTTGNGQQVSINGIKKEDSKSKFSISFEIKNNQARAVTNLSNNTSQSDLTVFKEYIEIPLSYNEIVKGEVNVVETEKASFIVINKAEVFSAKSNGKLSYKNLEYFISTKYKTSIDGLEFTIFKDDQLLAIGNTLGTIELLKVQNEELKFIFVSTITALIFNHLNTQ
jgi:hypothetical protein